MSPTTHLHQPEQQCIFCRIAMGLDPCHKVWEDAHYLAFLSIFPNTEGFTVVIPKQHLSSYVFDHPETEVNKLMAAARQVANRLVKKFETAARVALLFEGYGVNHLHAKLIPLHGTNTADWQKHTSCISTKFTQYPGYVSSHDAERVSDKTLAALARRLRE
ncbi:MAG TPA: HIT family protein [Amoebophilaceae bacterium]|jgi:diadenosine tetraphosphate (Ap4A) HIT family hydrolase|nr:HIT family protein [Amoebophilaceae bacterium]